MGQSLLEYCTRYDRRELLVQWHPEKNGALTPERVTSGSHRSVWWRCSQGHEWQSPAYARAGGRTGCPYCAGKRVAPGMDLRSQYPDIADQWHPEKNGQLTPDQFSPGSVRRVWWRCERGHEWQAEVYSRAAGHGCPVCTGQKVLPGENDLKSYDPELASQWHPQKNGTLTPSAVSVTSNRKVWWLCERGHEWQSAVSVRTGKRSGCPYCANRKVLAGFNDLKTVQPLVAAQWHPTKNGSLEPHMVLPGSSKRVWWRCTDGHEWRAVIYSRTGARNVAEKAKAYLMRQSVAANIRYHRRTLYFKLHIHNGGLKMKETTKRILSFVLAVVMVLGLLPGLPMAASAAGDTHYLMFATDRHANTQVIGNIINSPCGIWRTI